MPQPQRLNDPYDDSQSQEPITRPDLRALEGGGETSAPQTGHLEAAGNEDSHGFYNPHDDSAEASGKSGPNLKALEGGGETSAPQTGHLSEAGSALGAGSDKLGSGFNPHDKPNFSKRFKSQFRGKRKRALIGGGGTLGVLVGILAMLGVAQGPLQLIHLSEILQRDFVSNQEASNIRLNRLFRYAKTGDFGETRVGELGSRNFGKTISELKDIGIEFRTDPRSRVKAATFDSAKLEDRYPDLKGMSDTQRASFLETQFDLPEGSLERIGGVNGAPKFAVKTRDFGIKATRALLKNSLDVLDGGRIVKAMKFRNMAKFYNEPSLLHPIKKAKSALERKLSTKAGRAEYEKRQQQSISESVERKATPAEGDLKDKINGKNLASSALLLTAGMCLVRSVADDVSTINRDAIVIPAVLKTTQDIAVGAQIKSGQDITAAQAGAVAEGFQGEDGTNIWQGKALRVTAGESQTGPDLPNGYQQAFSNNTTASKIKKYLGGGGFGEVACSTPGQIVQGVIGAVILASGFFDGGASWAGKAVSAGAETAGTAGIMYMLQQVGVKLLASDSVVPKVLGGALGGNLLAYGAREAGNISARASGGIALTQQQSSQFDQQAQLAENEAWQSKSFFARMFDYKDYRSLTGQLADSLSPSFAQNISLATSSFLNFGHIFSSLATDLTPHIGATQKPYVWGFPQYGLPMDMLESNGTLGDPYANAQAAAKTLDSSSGSKYIDKAHTCFGVKISKNDGKWDVEQQDPVDPNTDDYQDAHCNDFSDKHWKNFPLFVEDTMTMKAAACYQGDEQSCTDVGFTSSDDSGSGPPTTPPGTLPTGNAQDLAKQILPFIKSGKVFCGAAAGGTESADCSDIQNTAKGTPIGGNCAVKSLSPHLLGLILGLVRDDGWTLGISAMCSDHHVEGDGAYAGHTYGSVADFSVQIKNGIRRSGEAAATDEQFVDDAAKLLSSTGGSFGQVTTPGHPSCHAAYASQKGGKFTLFADACSHQHIRAAP